MLSVLNWYILFSDFRVEGQGQMEAIIILEEFCKELSAIAFIKHHDAVTGDKC